MALTLLAGTPALTFIGLIGAALTVALRRGGLLLAVLVLPLTIPVLIFGVAASNAAIVGPVPFGTPFTILCALTLDERGDRSVRRRRGAAAWTGLRRDDMLLTHQCPKPVHRALAATTTPQAERNGPDRSRQSVALPRASPAASCRGSAPRRWSPSPSASTRRSVAPDDYQQGATVKIMFIHVPAAWLAMLGWTVMTIAALGTLVWRHPLADVAAKAAAPIGAGFTLICLITGSLWGRPMWGTYWVWDARLTSVLVLFLMYLGVIALWRTVDDPARGARAAAMLTLVGAINLPIIKFSVDWWNTLHQPALGAAARRPDHRSVDPAAAARHGGRLHAAVLDAASRRHAQRDPAAARAHHADAAGRRGGRALIHDRSARTRISSWRAYGVAIVVIAAHDRLGRRRPSPAAAHARRSRGARRHAPLRAHERGADLAMTPTEDEREGAADGGSSCSSRSRCFSGWRLLFLIRLGAGDHSRIPSALIGHPAPATELPPIAGLERDGKPVPGIPAARPSRAR